jgi:antitoxin MazE
VTDVIKLPKDQRAETRFVRKVGRHGNSLGVGLPKALADKLHSAQGDEVEFIENERGEVVLKKARKRNLPEGVRPEVLQVFL